ncbi:iron ABC transporter permease [Brevibacillus formosus]|uniref:Siderophore ABC transporter permease n=2 Tax=Brevibacillus formosus TaxID=54913 RepID=A0ABQ0T8C0_9BACL|nr:iron ABC transporter permease [Brevibacillus formosus]MED1958203.1 iron ABC transporter permease [Brevibacillus formosus]PSJ90236.1 iron ABC transporter [Brevibacillus formosus]GED59530.1 siderophore ABC transporter permease [Brevibacillus formosus]
MQSFLCSRVQKWTVLIMGIVLLALAMTASVLYGLQNFPLSTAIEAYTQFDGSTEHLIIKDTRVPRAITAAFVGGSLAVAGVLLQALTRNPLASPSVLGINSGAALFIVIALFLAGNVFAFTQLMWIGFLGAGFTAILVYLLGSAGRGGSSPLKVTLAGSAVAAFSSALTSLLMLMSNQTLEEALYWLVGSVSGRDLQHALMIIPYLFCGWMLAGFMAGSLNLMALGDDVATGLGQKIIWIKSAIVLVVVLLAGGSVALTGPIGFVGIMIPHIARYLVGFDHRWILPYSVVLGAIFLVVADVISRFLLVQEEVPVGVATAVLGVPFVIAIVRGRAHE